MSNSLILLDEPDLEFSHGQSAASPHDGLTLFGPYDLERPHHPRSLSYGIVGTPEGVVAAQRFLGAIRSPLINEADHAQLWPHYPGFETIFGTKLPERATFAGVIDREQLELASRHKDPHQRSAGVVAQYMHALQANADRDERTDVVLCVVPDFIRSNCRPESHVKNAVGERLHASDKRAAKGGQSLLFHSVDPEIYNMSEDFRRQLKARVMSLNMPIQIIRESTLALQTPADMHARQLTRLSDRAWNLSVALYYKAGAKPWRIKTARRGVCYVGLAYRRQGRAGDTACCAAQLFVDSGDGVVFRGRFGPWWSAERREFHMTKEAATNLLEGVLQTYNETYKDPLEEIFFHCRSGLNDEEWSGLQRATPQGVNLVGVKVQSEDGLRMMRDGRMPVMRGTFWEMNRYSGYLWATGYKPRLDTYDGTEIPVPLSLHVQRGNADIRQVARDIFGLTKLNYNACRFGESRPVTIGFSDAVGEILVSNRNVKNPKPHFRFYI